MNEMCSVLAAGLLFKECLPYSCPSLKRVLPEISNPTEARICPFGVRQMVKPQVLPLLNDDAGGVVRAYGYVLGVLASAPTLMGGVARLVWILTG